MLNKTFEKSPSHPLPFWKILSTVLLVAVGLALSVAPVGAANTIVASDYLAEFGGTLQDAVNAAGNQGMLVVDDAFVLNQPLVLPRFFRMVGMGPQGRGSLAYTLGTGAAIYFSGPESTSAVVIENLDIEGLYPAASPGASAGIALVNIQHVYLNNITVRGFDRGIVGVSAFYVHVRDSNVSLNRTHNYHLIDNANSWRITGGASSQSRNSAIRVETSNNTVIEQVSFESNQLSIHTSTESTHILNNRFECSPAVPMFCVGNPIGVHVDAGADQATLVGNYYSGLEPLLDTSNHGLTYRFDHAGGPLLQAPAGEEGLRVQLTSAGDELVFDADGRLHVGESIPGSTARLGINAPPGSEVLRAGIGGNTSLTVAADGRVGIGTIAPAEQLHVVGDLHVDGNIVTTGVLCIGGGC